MMKKLLLAFFLCFISTLAKANCTITALPFVLQNGTVADATQVMANFNQIFNGIQAGCAGAGANTDITSLTGVTSGLSANAGTLGELVSLASVGNNSTVTFTNGSANILWGANTPVLGQSVYFTTTGSLPTNFSANTTYYVVSVVGTTIQVSATYNGGAITAGSAGSGTQTGINAALLVNNTSRDIISTTLTPGDWTCSGNIGFSWNASGTFGAVEASIGNTANTVNVNGTLGTNVMGLAATNLNSLITLPTGEIDFNSASNIIVHLVADATFTGGAVVAAYGALRCRRIR